MSPRIKVNGRWMMKNQFPHFCSDSLKKEQRIRGNKFPLVQTYIQSHSEYCRIIDEKEIINAK